MSDTDATQARRDVAADVDEIIEHVINGNMLSMPYDVYVELFDAVNGLGIEIENLQSENTKLREELELWHRLTAGIELPEYPFNRLRWEELERENAKLRELIRAMWGCISHIGEYDVFYYDMAEDGCGMSCTVNGEHCCADKLYDRMHELGVVDE